MARTHRARIGRAHRGAPFTEIECAWTRGFELRLVETERNYGFRVPGRLTAGGIGFHAVTIVTYAETRTLERFLSPDRMSSSHDLIAIAAPDSLFSIAPIPVNMAQKRYRQKLAAFRDSQVANRPKRRSRGGRGGPVARSRAEAPRRRSWRRPYDEWRRFNNSRGIRRASALCRQ